MQANLNVFFCIKLKTKCVITEQVARAVGASQLPAAQHLLIGAHLRAVVQRALRQHRGKGKVFEYMNAMFMKHNKIV